ncbi:MAG: porin [Pseudomonadota bacterium]
MNKKLIALAVAGAFAAPVAATAADNVNIYGTLNVNFQTTEAKGATNPALSVSSRTALSTDSSNIGFRGVEDMGGGLKAIFQCETSANVDGIGVSGICNRNSNVGISGAWGTVFYGNWDTPFKAVTYGTKVSDPFLSTDVYAYQGIMSSPGFNYRSSAWKTATNTVVTGFDVRASNSVAYWTPNFGGLSGKVQYSATEFESANGAISPELWSVALNYDMGGLSVLAAYERHDDAFALAGANGAAGAAFGSTAANNTTANSEDTAWRLGAGYQFNWGGAGATTISVLYENLTLEQSGVAAGAVTEYERDAWQVALTHRIGNHEFRARYNDADQGDCTLAGGAACSTSGYAAKMYALGYAYHFSKRTQGYISYAKIKNEASAQYTLSIGGSPNVAGATPAGADPEALGLGIRHSF